MGWINSLLEKKVAAHKAAELQSFVASLRTLTDSEMAELVAYATHTRHLVERLGVDLLVPNDIYITHPALLPELIKKVNTFQTQGNVIAATSMMVWTHTIRATTPPDLKQLGCAMWQELARGFAGATMAAGSIALRTGQELDTRGAGKVPFSLDG